jgi:hypothetical protein
MPGGRWRVVRGCPIERIEFAHCVRLGASLLAMAVAAMRLALEEKLRGVQQ